MVRSLFIGMSLCLISPAFSVMATEEDHVESQIEEPVEDSYLNNLPVMLTMLTEEMYGSNAVTVKEMIQTQIEQKEDTYDTATKFLEHILNDYIVEERDYDFEEKIVDLFVSLYAEEVLDGVKEYYLKKIEEVSFDEEKILDTIHMIDEAEKVEDIYIAYDLLMTDIEIQSNTVLMTEEEVPLMDEEELIVGGIEEDVQEVLGDNEDVTNENVETVEEEADLETQRTIALEGLAQAYENLDVSEELLKKKAEEVYALFIEKIHAAGEVSEILTLMDEGILKIQDIQNETDEIVFELKEEMIATLDIFKSSITSEESLTEEVYDIAYEKIMGCVSSKELTIAGAFITSLYEHFDNALSGDAEAVNSLVLNLRNYAPDEETASILEYLSSTQENTDTKSLSRLEHAVYAFQYSKGSFLSYLEDELQKEVTEMEGTKKEMAVQIVSEAVMNMQQLNKKEAYLEYENTFLKLGSIDESILEAAKAAAVTQLNEYLSSSESVEKLIHSYTTKIERATSEEEINQYLEEGKTLIEQILKAEESKDLLEKKEAAKAALSSLWVLGENSSKELLESYLKQIDYAETAAEVERLLTEGRMALEEEQKAFEEKLSNAKNAAFAELTSLCQEVSDAEISEKLSALLGSAQESIDIAENVEEVEEILSTKKQEIQKIMDGYHADLNLSATKESVKSQIDALVSKITNSELKEILSKLAQAAKKEVEASISETEVSNCLSQFKMDIQTAMTEYSADKTLVTKKSTVVENLEKLKEGKKISEAASTILSQAKTDIMNATTLDDVQTIYETAVSDFQTQYLKDLRETYLSKLEDLYDEASITDTTLLSQIRSVITKARSNIEAATNETVMQNIVSQAINTVNTLTAASVDEHEDSLVNAKQQAIETLNSYILSSSDSAKKIISAYTNKIQNATSNAQIEEYLAEARSILSKLEEAEASSGNSASVDENVVNDTENNAQIGNEAEEKGDTIVESVKTGDENVFSIIVSLCVILGGMGTVVGIGLKRRNKKKH